MYKSATVFLIAQCFLILGIVRHEWINIVFGLGGLCLAAYIYYVIEDQPAPRHSIFSQLALFVLGLSALTMGGLAFLRVAESAQDQNANWFLLILGFSVTPMFMLIGLAMSLCALFSRRLSHEWLMYLITEPSRRNAPLGEIPPAYRVTSARKCGKDDSAN